MDNTEYYNKKNSFDPQTHELNIKRRIMERNAFGIDTRSSKYEINGNNNDLINNNPSNIGEITGKKFDQTQIEQGMPIRPFLKTDVKDRFLDPNYNTNYNPYLDFDLYESKPRINVSYYDPSYKDINSNVNFSDINENSNLLQPIENLSEESIFSGIINNFTFDFFYKFNQNLKTKKSLIISPFCILQSFILLYIASKKDTEDELKTFFSLNDKKIVLNNLYKLNNELKNSKNIYKLNMVCVPNYMNLNKEFLSYSNKLVFCKKYDPLKSNIECQKINQIISKGSNGKINDIIQTNMLGPTSNIILINTFYFNSKWKISFNELSTKKEYFYGILTYIIPMMTQIKKNYKYYEDNMNQILEMDYYDNNFCMGFILPKTSYNDPLITNEQFQYYITQMKMENINLLKIPKFKQETRYKIDNLFKKYGMNELFVNANLGDLIHQTNNNSIFVSDIIHSCVISVDEHGVNNKNNDERIISSRNINFIANHPFFYYVRYKPYNTVLLLGQFY